MPSCSPERRSSRVITGGRRIGALVMVVAFAAAALAGPADASKISDTRAQVRAIEQQLNAMDIKLEASIQAYDGAQQHLTDVRHQIAQNTIKLRVAKHNLKVSRARLAVFMVNAYKGTDVNDDPAAYVLGAGSFSDLVTRVEDVQRIGASEHALLKQVTTAEREISTRQAQLKSEERDAAKLVAQKKQQKAAIEAGLQQRRDLLSSTKGELGHLLHERQVHQQQAAAAAAAALAQQQQQQQEQQAPPPSNGGGSDRLVRRRRHVQPAPGRHARPAGGRDRAAVPGRPVRVGRRQPLRLRLLGPRGLRVRAAGRVAAPLHRLALELGRARRRATSWHPATSSSSTASTTSASTWAAGCSSTPPTPAQWCRSRA